MVLSSSRSPRLVHSPRAVLAFAIYNPELGPTLEKTDVKKPPFKRVRIGKVEGPTSGASHLNVVTYDCEPELDRGKPYKTERARVRVIFPGVLFRGLENDEHGAKLSRWLVERHLAERYMSLDPAQPVSIEASEYIEELKVIDPDHVDGDHARWIELGYRGTVLFRLERKSDAGDSGGLGYQWIEVLAIEPRALGNPGTEYTGKDWGDWCYKTCHNWYVCNTETGIVWLTDDDVRAAVEEGEEYRLVNPT